MGTYTLYCYFKNMYMSINSVLAVTGSMNQIEEFQVKTRCSSDAGTNNDIKFVLCQNGKCCSIQGLPATLGNPDCKKIESFENSQLGDCATMSFDNSEITGSISYADPTNWSDGYTGEYIKIILPNGDFHRCPIDGRIDGDDGGPPERDISCKSFNSNKGNFYSDITLMPHLGR